MTMMPSISKLNFLPTWVDLQITLDAMITFNIPLSTLWKNNMKALRPDLLD